MNSIINFFAESLICFSLFYLFFLIIQKRETCFQYNRLYLLGTASFSIVIPLINIPLRSTSETIQTLTIEQVMYLPEITIGAESNAVISNNWGLILIISIYLAGLAFFLIRFLYELYKILRLIFRNKKQIEKISGNIRVIKTNGQLPTFSFLNFIFWNNMSTLDENEKKQILAHEKIHVQHKHSLDIIFLEVMSIFLWFNPFIRLYKKAIAEAHEYIADHHTIDQSNKDTYIQTLVKQSISNMNMSLAHHFNKSQILNRINMIDMYEKRPDWIKVGLLIPVLGLLFLVFSCQEEEILPDNSLNNQQISSTEMNDDQVSIEEANLEYPDQARKMGIEGKVFVQFVVDKDGSITEVKAIKGIEAGCDDEAVRVLENSPVWIPGRQNGQPVKVRMILPITFKIS